MTRNPNMPFSLKKLLVSIFVGFFALCLIGAIVGSGSKSTSTKAQTTPAATNSTPVSRAAKGEKEDQKEAEDAYQMDASCELKTNRAHNDCEEIYANRKTTEASEKAKLESERGGTTKPSAQIAVNPIWLAETTTACEHEDKATGTLSASCNTTITEVCNTPVDEASPAIVAAESELKADACKMEALSNAQNSISAQEGENE
jgi:hypothetical protein